MKGPSHTLIIANNARETSSSSPRTAATLFGNVTEKSGGDNRLRNLYLPSPNNDRINREYNLLNNRGFTNSASIL